MGKLRRSRWVDTLRRSLAMLCAVFVFALGLFAANPPLHARLHHHAAAPDDGCAVVLFANGVTLAVATIPVPLPSTRCVEAERVRSPELFLDSPRYRLQPERGPPVG